MRPACSSARVAATPIERTACLNVSRPFIFSVFSFSAAFSVVVGSAAAAAGHMENVAIVAVAAHVGRDDAVRTRAITQDGGAGAVAEEHAGIAILPVHDRAELVGADHEDGVVGMVRDECCAISTA